MAKHIDAIITSGMGVPETVEGIDSLDLRYGGQSGRHARIGGFGVDGVFEEWQSNFNYVRRNVFPILMSYPKMFDDLPNSEYLIESLKSLIETRLVTIDGLNSKLSVEFGEATLGNTQEVIQHVTNVKRERSQITTTIQETAGCAVERFLTFMIQHGYMHEDLKMALYSNYITEAMLLTPDYTTFSVLFIEPDILQRTVTRAWLSVNCMFDNAGEIVGKKTQDMAGELVEHSIGITSLTMYNPSVRALAQDIYDNMQNIRVAPDETIALPLDEIEPEITDANFGYDRDPE